MRKYIYLGLFLFAVVVFLVHYVVSGQAVYGDGIGYYSHLHSFVIDRDWDYTNEYKHIYDAKHNNANTGVESPVVQIVATNASGKAENFYGTGVAVLLLPFYLLAHIISIGANFFGVGLSIQGYGDLYQILTGVGAIMYALIGVRFLEKTVYLVIKNEKVSLISAITIYLASSLLYYGSFDVINSHFASFFLTSLFFYLFISDENKNKYLLLGLVAGLLTINRIQDSVVVILLLISFWRDKKHEMETIGKYFLGFVFGLVPLIVHWSMVFGNPLNQPYFRGLSEKFLKGQFPDILGSLFNPVTGLFFRTPLLLVVFIYFLFLIWCNLYRFRVKPGMTSTSLFYPFIFFVMQFVTITAQGGWSAAAYGGRMYISSLIFFAIVLGKLLLRLERKNGIWVYLFVSFFIVLNFASIAIFILRDKGAEGGTHGTEQRTLKRLDSLLK